jgi:hypothetical protein
MACFVFTCLYACLPVPYECTDASSVPDCWRLSESHFNGFNFPPVTSTNCPVFVTVHNVRKGRRAVASHGCHCVSLPVSCLNGRHILRQTLELCQFSVDPL